MTELLALQGLTKSFGQVSVAASLDFTLETGATLGIVGPNGAGKTTLFAMISGDLLPDSGAVRLDGADVTHLPAYRRCRAGIGRTYQIPRPFEKMTVFENVLVSAQEGGAFRGEDAVRKATDTLDQCGLLAYVNQPAGSLALMLRKRLEIARGLATQPKLLLLDEVAGGLTEPEVFELTQLIRSVHASGMTIMWIEHVVHALADVVERMTCLAGGNIIADGIPQAVLADDTVRELYLGQTPGTARET